MNVMNKSTKKVLLFMIVAEILLLGGMIAWLKFSGINPERDLTPETHAWLKGVAGVLCALPMVIAALIHVLSDEPRYSSSITCRDVKKGGA